jgi:hypothetical protein
MLFFRCRKHGRRKQGIPTGDETGGGRRRKGVAVSGGYTTWSRKLEIRGYSDRGRSMFAVWADCV